MSHGLQPRNYEISSQARIGVYDCLYDALAEREGCGLLTADDRLVRALQPTYPFITPLSSLP
jgi:predicted nucleic acid-binding protein